jgi:hypothetical protein
MESVAEEYIVESNHGRTKLGHENVKVIKGKNNMSINN